MSGPLVIVESPTKAKSIGRFLRAVDPDVKVEASMGHVRDLPGGAKELPERYKKEPWAYLAVNVDDGFEPVYVVSARSRPQIKKLKELLADADELFLATDEDREGEAIAWHLLEVLKPKVPVKRMVFHEITEQAIRDAFDHPREIDERLVDAQETRRVLDRLVGYDVSRVLWMKVRPRLSAGRVQSVAVRIVVERERERMAFRSASYWDIAGTFGTDGGTFAGSLVAVDGVKVASGKDYSADGTLDSSGVLALDEEQARGLVAALDGTEFTVRSTDKRPYTRKPYAPFRTSTLQQEAGRKLRFSSARTMQVAQRLYENGHITYMRTDSTSLAEAAVVTARSEIQRLYGDDYVPDSPRVYASKAKNAQEAHEAIRPAGETWATPAQVERDVDSPDEARLYDLIWKRTLASQMPDARGESLSVRFGATASDGRDAEFGASGRVIHFPGFLKVYVESVDDPDAETDDTESRLPPLDAGDQLDVLELAAAGHETKPPRRYTEASLVQRLEELGVGRPSTFASIIQVILDRQYVWKKSGALVPSFVAFSVVTLLEHHFPELVDYAFTARMEDDLDRIADGTEERTPWLTRFYLGDDGLRETIARNLEEIDAREINSIPIGADDQDRLIVARVGKFGPFLERGEDRGSIPDDLPPDELTVEKATQLIDDQSKGDKILGTDPESGLVVLARTGRFGPYVQLGEQEEGSKTKPKRASLLKGMEIDELGLDTALELLSLPRLVGADDDGIEIRAFNGKYGPYIKRGDDSRSLESEDQLFTVTRAEALELLAQPPRRRGQAKPSGPLKELGDDPVSKKPVTVRSGRYGPYVTDGDVNASLRKGDSPDSITLERAAELLADRRARLGR
ncbi:MAG: type I DNA topoisomerase [Acidimicrobiia bacterium]|nr:type I DNA topoisomerase [Acidimicrobiia bacterium]MDH4309198.1 type I DNA topoisomerase [Acidimicrobiia bacterium]